MALFHFLMVTSALLGIHKKEIGQLLLAQFEGDGELYGNYAVTRVRKPNYSKVKIDDIVELGAVKTVPDTTMLSKLLRKGVEVKGVSYIEYPLVQPVEKDDMVDLGNEKFSNKLEGESVYETKL